MHAFFLSRPLMLHVAGQRKIFRAVADVSAPLLTEIHLAAQMEIDHIRDALRERYPDEAPETLLHFLTPQTLAQISGMPMLLGIAGLNQAEAEARRRPCLVEQLTALRLIQPGRQHYRLLLVNGFGANLGDCLMGLTAFRQVLPVLRAELPAVSVDVLLGWHGYDGLQRLFRASDGIDAVLTQGPTLAGLSRYQAMFDTSELLNLPRYGSMPVVDWNLWWMGLDPDSISGLDKRNRLAIPQLAQEIVKNDLPAHSGPRILINPKASVALRCMPESACRRLLESLISNWPQAQVVLIQPLAFEHPQVVHLSGKIDNVDQLAAVVAQVDGLIGVDTYTQHLADATDTPAVTIYTSVPPLLYPYYPFVAAISLPDVEQLPAWGKMKVSADMWESMAPAYEAAWLALDWNAVLSALEAAMSRQRGLDNPDVSSEVPNVSEGASRTRSVIFDGNRVEVPRYQRDDPLQALLNQTFLQIARQRLCLGDVVVQLGAGAGELSMALAALVGRQGRLVIFEPRRQLHQQLCANLAHSAIFHAETHAVMPDGKAWAVRDIHRLHVADDYLPLQFSNASDTESVVCWPLDHLNLQACQLLIVSSPLLLLSVLQGAQACLKRLKPTVLAGVVALQSTADFETYLDGLGYRVRILELGDPRHSAAMAYYGIIVAEPVSGELSRMTVLS